MIALTSQGADLRIQLIDQRSLLAKLGLDFGCVLFCGDSALPLPLYQFNRAHDALFESREIVRTQGKGANPDRLLGGALLRGRTFCHFRFPQRFRHMN